MSILEGPTTRAMRQDLAERRGGNKPADSGAEWCSIPPARTQPGRYLTVIIDEATGKWDYMVSLWDGRRWGAQFGSYWYPATVKVYWMPLPAPPQEIALRQLPIAYEHKAR